MCSLPRFKILSGIPTALGTAQDLPAGPVPDPGHKLAMSVLRVFACDALSCSQAIPCSVQPFACHFKEQPSPSPGRGVKMFLDSTAGVHERGPAS